MLSKSIYNRLNDSFDNISDHIKHCIDEAKGLRDEIPDSEWIEEVEDFLEFAKGIIDNLDIDLVCNRCKQYRDHKIKGLLDVDYVHDYLLHMKMANKK